MTLGELLTSLSGAERDYIAMTDYGNDAKKHREQLDVVIDRGGAVDMEAQYWFPYEVIELRKNQLEKGHEREFTACAGIVLRNIVDGSDRSNDAATILDCVSPYTADLPVELRSLLSMLFDAATEKT